LYSELHSAITISPETCESGSSETSGVDRQPVLGLLASSN